MFKKFFKKLDDNYWKDRRCTTVCTVNIDGFCCNVSMSTCLVRNCKNKNIKIGF